MNTNRSPLGWHGSAVKNLLPFLLLCFASLAAAEASKGGISPDAHDLVATKTGFSCAPFPIGNGTMLTLRSNSAGTVAWWYCRTSSGEWRLSCAAATAESLRASNVLAEAQEVVAAKDSVAAFHAAVTKRVNLSIHDPSLVPVWQPFLAEMLSGAPAAEGKPGSTTQLKSDSRPNSRTVPF